MLNESVFILVVLGAVNLSWAGWVVVHAGAGSRVRDEVVAIVPRHPLLRTAGHRLAVLLVEHPARMECGVEIAATEFAPSYRRATVMQATLAGVGLLGSIAAWFEGATFCWLIGGGLLGLVIPFTLIVILPTNKQLLNPALNRRSLETERLLARWAALHAVRSVLSGLALLLFLYLMIFRRAL